MAPSRPERQPARSPDRRDTGDGTESAFERFAEDAWVHRRATERSPGRTGRMLPRCWQEAARCDGVRPARRVPDSLMPLRPDRPAGP